MGLLGDVAAQLRRVVLLDDKVERLVADVVAMKREVNGLDRRVLVIETLIAAAREARGAPVLPPRDGG